MKHLSAAIATIVVALVDAPSFVYAQPQQIPNALKPWQDWATWDDATKNAPPTYQNWDERISVWPSTLAMSANQQTGSWKVSVQVFAPAWVAMPGDADQWPVDVKSSEETVPVVQRNGVPSVRLSPGRHDLTGSFQWESMPQRIAIPREIGVLSLRVRDADIPIPNWDSNGYVWLQRAQTEQLQQDLLAVQVYRVLEDGIPTRLQTEIEITVSGKSREESLGWILPAGFLLASIDSPLPVAVNDQGEMKAQVRAGKWTITASAFR
ncbi:MAG: hypothetical protein KDB27_01960, partial [Planctomycetales bacterium]|nr:hypothetical protein [Planctomycetales bacterium]